ncbi:MAG: hypothetical protein F7B18_01700 [Desulfurococcales archaeon]|nr:hypothetical protein [Desulfurococcales archaeon]
METWRILVAIGGILALLAGLTSLATGTPLAEMLFGLNLVEGTIVRVMGIIGIVGGLIALYAVQGSNPRLGLVGGVLGLLAPCGLAILAVVGGGLGMARASQQQQ